MNDEFAIVQVCNSEYGKLLKRNSKSSKNEWKIVVKNEKVIMISDVIEGERG